MVMVTHPQSNAYPDPVADAIAVIGDRWSLLILTAVFNHQRRFEELVRELGISRKILAQRLALLCGHKVLTRVAYQQRPVRYEYRLTELGLELFPVIWGLQRWGALRTSGEPPRLRHLTCDNLMQPQLTCPQCRLAVSAWTIRREP